MYREPSNLQPISDPVSVLVVEDDDISRKALAKLLRACGYPTLAVASAEEALQVIQEGILPRAALIDIDLPGMDGLCLAEQLKALCPQTQSILTTAADPVRVRDFCARHDTGFLPKPLNLPKLLLLLGARQSPLH